MHDLHPVNMHIHTHFSFNALGLSPSALVKEAVARGLYAAAICDFDVLDGLEEFYAAADAASFRAAAGLETRVFFSEYANDEINSPGEPGVYYFMGMGFGRVPGADSPAGKSLAQLRRRASQRNQALVERINQAYPEMAVDYTSDVLPLTPSGNATERHIVSAYILKVRAAAKDDPEFERTTWGKALGLPQDKLAAVLRDEVALQNTIRSKLMKAGGVGYVQPDYATFPPLETVIAMILDAGAIPMAAWLDGLSSGERDMATQLECLRAKGVAALNIVPDRSWNIADPERRRVKVERLYDVVRVANRMQLPINVGTELNSFGQPFVDDFESEALRPLWPDFMRGANIMIAQARLARFAGVSYCDPAAQSALGTDTAARNDCFERIGRLPCPNAAERARLVEMGKDRAFAALMDAAKQ